MPIILERAATRRCVRIFDDDYEYLQNVARANGISRDMLIRQIINRHVKNLQNRESAAVQLIDVLDTEIDIDEICALELEGK